MTGLGSGPTDRDRRTHRRAHKPRQRRIAIVLCLTAVALVLEVVPRGSLLPGLTPEAKADPPTLSDADPAYPLNHTFDGKTEALDSAANADFESASEEVGTPPENVDLEDDPVTLATPTNADFETGTFSGWTTTSDPSIATDNGDDWAQLGSSDTMTSSALDISSDAQAIVYNVNYVTTTSYSSVRVYVLSGTDFATSTLLMTDSCYQCGYWSTTYVDVSGYQGQQIKLKFSRYGGVVGVDDVSIQEVFPGHTLVGNFRRDVDGQGDHYVSIASSSVAVTTDAFAVDEAAQQGTVQIKGTGNSPQYRIKVAVGPSYSTYTDAKIGYASTSAWEDVRFDLSPYVGEDIKVRVTPITGTIHADDIGTQLVEVPDWSVPDSARRTDDGAGGNYVTTTGTLISSAVDVAANAQNISLRVRSKTSALDYFFVELLTGASFATVDQLAYTSVGSTWTTLTYGVGTHAGNPVKLRIRPWSGPGLNVDDAGLVTSVLPGWAVTDDRGIAVGEDAYGSYVTTPIDNQSYIRSSWITPGIIDTTSTQTRWYTLAYDIGAGAGTNLSVTWANDQSQSWIVLSTASNDPTGYVTARLPIHDFMGDRGRFSISFPGLGRIYSLGDNVARQQLSEPFSSKVGMGIDTTTGAVAFAEQDLTLPGAMPLTFSRYYNAHSDRLGTLGYRWSHTYDTHLEFSGSDVAVVFGQGREDGFLHQTNGTYRVADPRVHSALVKETDGTFTLTTKENLLYRFAAAGVLTEIEDLNGNAIELAYDGQGRLSTVTAPGDRTLELAYQSGRLSTVTDPLGAVFSYAYDSGGDLVSVTDPEDGERTYTYDHHRLVTVTDQELNQVVENTYDDFGRVLSQTDAASQTIGVTYDTPGKGATLITDPEGGESTFYFDGYHRTAAAVDPTDHVISYIYDSVGNLDAIVDPENNEWDFDFDDDGDLLEALDPLANPVSFTYNAKHLPTTVTDGRGNSTTLAYDTDGNLTSQTDPLDRETTFTYDTAGNMTSRTDPLANAWNYTYDADGNKTSETDPLDNVTTYTYDAAGRLKTEVDPLGATTTYFYDLLGRLILIRDPLDRDTEFLFDAVGHLIRVTDAEGAETLWDYDERGLVEAKTNANGDTTTYTYDDNGRMTSVTDPLANETTYAYDDAGRLVSVTDPFANETTYAYDDAGRLVSETDPLARVTTYAYDAAGRLLETGFPNDAVVGYAYDEVGNLTQVTDALQNVTVRAYDEANQLASVTDPLSNQTTYAYDDAGRLVSETDPLGSQTAYTFDDAGRMTAVTDPLDNITQYTLDDAGRTIELTDASGRSTTQTFDLAGQLVVSQDGLGNETTYAYDDVGRLVSLLMPSGAETLYAYDALGARTSTTDPLGNVTLDVYDDAGRLVTETDPLGNDTAYAYDDAGRMTSITDALGGVVSFGYDGAGQLTTLTDPLGQSWTYTYDELGNRASVTDPLANVTELVYDARGQLVTRTDARGVETDWAYDERGLPEGVSFPGGSISYGYDDSGRRTSMTDATGTTTWAFDDAGRVTATEAPAGTIGYGYDDAGRRASMTLPGGREIGYGYDLAGRLTSMVDPSDDQIAFGYDEDGQRTAIQRPNDVDSTYVYDDAGRITSITHAGTGGTIAAFSYSYDDAGRRTSVTTAAGTETYVHDDLGQLVSVEYADGQDVSYTYDDAGNRLTETRDNVTTSYSYDDASRLTQVGSTTYTYDDAGNLVEAGSDGFTYDYANRLVTASVGAHDATYTYDGDGVRVAADVDGSPSELLVDRESGLPTIVDDGDAAYLQADGLIERSGTSASFPLLDAIGSVRSVTDASGAVTASAAYEAFGAIRSQTGSASAFGFTGEPTDATGLVYLRARTLDPATARFLQVDSVRPGGSGTVGYNLYAYATNDPTTLTDPSGHFVPSPAEWTLARIALAFFTHPVFVIVVVFLAVACVLSTTCRELLFGWMDTIDENGSAGDTQQPLPDDPTDAPTTYPGTPVPPIPPGNGPGGVGTTDCDPPGDGSADALGTTPTRTGGQASRYQGRLSCQARAQSSSLPRPT